MRKRKTRVGSFVYGLAGVLVGAMLVTALPAGGASGDNMVLGASNKSGRSTWLASRGYSTLKLNNTAGGLALDLRVLPGTAPLAVNSNTRVRNLNSDLLDGIDSTGFLGATAQAADSDRLDGQHASAFLRRGIYDPDGNQSVEAAEHADSADTCDMVDGQHASAFLGATAQATDSDLLDGQHGPFYRNASNINSGTLSTDRFDAYGNLYYSGWLNNSHGLDLLTRIQADNRYINTGETAADSSMVDGFDANQLVRVAHAETTEVDEVTVFGSYHYGDILSTQINAPTRGLLFIVASADSDVAGGVDEYYCQLHVNETGVVGTVRWVSPESPRNHSENCSTNGLKEVAAGTYTVGLHIEQRRLVVNPGNPVDFHDASLQVLFVPFGAYGNQP